MSASLVGSEMCIRDRLEASSFCRFRALERGVRALGKAQTAAFSSWASVSYTHLTLPTICSV
eukprot:14585039-Alexandrium_andersonii.AAC.1